MAEINTQFFARIDSNTSNSPDLNLSNDPAFLIEFTNVDPDDPLVTGDYDLETNNGGADDDTWVIIDGITYEFIYEFSAELPETTGGANPKVPLELSEKDITLITVIGYPPVADENGDLVPSDETTRLAFSVDAGDDPDPINDLSNGNIPLGPLVTPPVSVCYCEGSMIETPNGAVAVENLQKGALVLTKDTGAQPVLWMSSSLHVWPEDQVDGRPILISAGGLDKNVPTQDLMVSPQHHILFSSDLCLELFGTKEVLAPAKGLTGLPGVRVMAGKKAAEYYHVMTPQHEILVAHGVETESFYPGPTAVRMLNAGQRASLFAVVPELRDDPENGYGPVARKRITRRQAEQLVDAIKAQTKQNKAMAG